MVWRKEHLAVLTYDYPLCTWAATAWRRMNVLLPIASWLGGPSGIIVGRDLVRRSKTTLRF